MKHKEKKLSSELINNIIPKKKIENIPNKIFFQRYFTNNKNKENDDKLSSKQRIYNKDPLNMIFNNTVNNNQIRDNLNLRNHIDKNKNRQYIDFDEDNKDKIINKDSEIIFIKKYLQKINEKKNNIIYLYIEKIYFSIRLCKSKKFNQKKILFYDNCEKNFKIKFETLSFLYLYDDVEMIKNFIFDENQTNAFNTIKYSKKFCQKTDSTLNENTFKNIAALLKSEDPFKSRITNILFKRSGFSNCNHI